VGEVAGRVKHKKPVSSVSAGSRFLFIFVSAALEYFADVVSSGKPVIVTWVHLHVSTQRVHETRPRSVLCLRLVGRREGASD